MGGKGNEMRILAIISGDYGRRHVDNLRANGPDDWRIEVWQAPSVLPPIVDYPEDHLPESLPASDLILSFAELKGVAELLPDIARMTGAQAVIAAVDNEAWLPRGLARQLRRWLGDLGVACATPKPLCSLTEARYGVARREEIAYGADGEDEGAALIAAFARHFGRPELHLTVDPETRVIVSAEVRRDAVCGCARHVAQELVGVSADEAEQAAGLLHHHYPCLASMGVDPAFGDTLMHVSGNILKDDVAAQVRPFKQVRYHVPDQ
jgi:hypothetical protein